MPDIRQFVTLPEDDRNELMRLFGIRQKIWKGELISETDQSRWESARLQVPNWPLFKRLELSAEETQAQAEAAEETARGWETFLAEADEVSIREEDGVETISATFRLSDEPPSPVKKSSWWQRVLHRFGQLRK